MYVAASALWASCCNRDSPVSAMWRLPTTPAIGWPIRSEARASACWRIHPYCQVPRHEVLLAAGISLGLGFVGQIALLSPLENMGGLYAAASCGDGASSVARTGTIPTLGTAFAGFCSRSADHFWRHWGRWYGCTDRGCTLAAAGDVMLIVSRGWRGAPPSA